MGVKSPDISSAIISRHCVRKGPKPELLLGASALTVTGNQLIPSVEYAIVHPVLLFVLSNPATFVRVATDPPFHPPARKRPPTASQMTRVTSLPILNNAVEAALACVAGANQVFPVASVEYIIVFAAPLPPTATHLPRDGANAMDRTEPIGVVLILTVVQVAPPFSER